MNQRQSFHLTQLQALLPHGKAWPREPDAILTKVLAGLAHSSAQTEEEVDALVREADPRLTHALLTDWERVLGLPDCGIVPATMEERRQAVQAKLTENGLINDAGLVELATRLGFDITINHFSPFRAGDTAGSRTYGIDWAFAKEISAPAETVQYLAAGRGAAGEPLRIWGREAQLECAVRRNTHAHVVLNFSYGG